MSQGPKRSILDQNGIKLLDTTVNYGNIIASPMFFWELYNNCNTKLETDILNLLKPFSNSILVTYKSTTCEFKEIKRKQTLNFKNFLDRDNTTTIRDWLGQPQPKLNQLRDTLSPGLTAKIFNSRYTALANDTWLPFLQSEFDKFGNSSGRMSFRNDFDAIDNRITQKLFENTLHVCFEILKRESFTRRQSVLFLSNPSVLYNRVFGAICVQLYRSTHTDKSYKPEKLANDLKDYEYLFIAHLCDNIIGQDAFFTHLYNHLKQSHHILRNTSTGL